MRLKFRFYYYKLIHISINSIEFASCNHRIHYSLL